MKRLWVKISLAVGLLFVLIVVLIPMLVRPDTFRPMLETQLSAALSRKVTLGKLDFSLLKGSLEAHDIAIADDPAFSNSPMLTARAFGVGVDVPALVFHHQLRIQKLTLDEPAIQLIESPAGVWNFSTIGAGKASPSDTGAATARPDLFVGELRLNNGIVTRLNQSVNRRLSYSAINLSAHNASLAAAFPFEAKASLPAGGKAEVKGTVGPIAEDASKTPFEATLGIKSFDPVATGALDAAAGITMLVDANAKVKSDGKTATSVGRIQAARLHVGRTGKPSAKPVEIDFNVASDLVTRKGKVRDLAIKAGSAAAHVTGEFEVKPAGAVVHLKLEAPGIPIDALEDLLPAFGVALPAGSQLKGGTLSTSLAIDGPVATPEIQGPIDVANTVLVGYDIGSKIQGMNPFGGSHGGTAVEMLHMNVKTNLAWVQLSEMEAVLPQVGTATGEGTMSAAEDLDFHMTAKFAPSAGAGVVLGKALNGITGAVSGFLNKTAGVGGNLGKGVPLTVTGKASNPTIKADFTAMFKSSNQASNVNASSTSAATVTSEAKSLLSGFLKKK